MSKEIPKNWVETKLKKVLFLKNGYAFKSKNLSQTGDIPVIKIGNIKNYGIEINQNFKVKSDLAKEDFLIHKGDILIAMSGATTGKFGIYKLDIPVLQNQRVGNLKLHSEKSISKKIIYYLLWGLKKKIEDLAYGGAQPNISSSKIENIKFLLPPLTEQQRIVVKLDSLFARLDAIKASLAKIPELLQNFRQQVLTQAVTGKLTEEWREGRDLGEWKSRDISYLVNSLKSDIRTGPFGSALKKTEHQSNGIPVWGIESIGKNGEFTGLNKIFVTEEKAKILKSFEVKGGSLIISRSGTVGEICILPNDVEYGLISTNLMKIVLNNDTINSKLFCWQISSLPSIQTELEELCKGSTRLFLTQKILKQLIFLIPTGEEQQKIVKRVEKLFAKADKIQEQYEALNAKIEQLPQAILHKAFKGGLVPQLESDGNARDLLREIEEMKKATDSKTINRKRKIKV